MLQHVEKYVSSLDFASSMVWEGRIEKTICTNLSVVVYHFTNMLDPWALIFISNSYKLCIRFVSRLGPPYKYKWDGRSPQGQSTMSIENLGGCRSLDRKSNLFTSQRL